MPPSPSALPALPRDRLLALLVAHAYQYRPEGEGFLLASGQRSPEYLDCKQALSQPEALPALGACVLSLLSPGVVAVGGLTMGADPLAIATAYASSATGRGVRWFSVRKEPKGHGRRKTIEGSVAPGECVTILDDVVTTGGSTLDAIIKARDAGLVVAQVVVLVDREQGGMAKIEGEVGPTVPVVALFTRSEIRHAWQSLHAPSRQSA